MITLENEGVCVVCMCVCVCVSMCSVTFTGGQLEGSAPLRIILPCDFRSAKSKGAFILASPETPFGLYLNLKAPALCTVS